MTWQVINVEPAHGICDQCKRHDCGIVDGQHKWILTGMEDRYGDRLVIGYNCAKLWAQNLGIGREVVEREIVRDPTDEEIGRFFYQLRDHLFGEVKPNGDNDSRVDADGNQPDTSDPAPDRRRKANQGAAKGQGTRQRTKRAN